MSSAALVVSRRSEDRLRVFRSSYDLRVFRSLYDLRFDESIIIEVNGLGNMHRAPLRVFKDETILSVKLKIQNCTGIVFKNQKLVYGGRELSRSDSLVRDYDIENGDVFHIMVKVSDLQLIKVRTVCGKKLSFKVDRFQNVASVKKEIAKKVKGLGYEEDHELIYDGEELDDQVLCNDIVKHNDNGVILLIVRKSSKGFELSIDASDVIGKKSEFECDGDHEGVEKDMLVPVVGNLKSSVPKPILDVIEMTKNGLANGHSPIMSGEGSGGAYLMRDSTGSEYVSVFKPTDEEPKAMNNPHGLPLTSDGEGLKRGTRVGQGAFREVAAYLLDHPFSGRRGISGDAIGFSGVPPTGMVKCLHNGFNHPNGIKVKLGSLQKFMKNNGSCEDIGPGAFPVEEVHKISVLDLRLANADRHSGNILFSKDGETGRITLIPIDHGYCLPESFEDCTFDWLYWPQAKQPYSPETVNYIKSLDAEKDIELLKFYGWDMPVETARTLRISTMLLKKGVERGLTPYAIGNIMCRETVRKESVIEEILREAMKDVLPGTSEETLMETVSQIMDRRLDEMSG